MTSDLKTRRVDSFDGAQIEYLVSAPRADRPALLFLHGWGCKRNFWARQVEAFRGEFPVLALDLAGHGGSSGGSRAWTIEEFARDVSAVIEAESIGQSVAIGHSMGGAVAVEFARRAATRVRGVIAVDSLTYPTVYPRVPEKLVSQSTERFRADFRKAVEATMEPVFTPGMDPELKAEILDALASTPREPGVASIAGLLRWDGREAIAACATPIHCLNAEAFLDRDAARRYAPTLQIETMAGVGHFLMMEEPERFNAALRRILERIG
jgi:pimeloyl-ACP methyl ester carboxylesterase